MEFMWFLFSDIDALEKVNERVWVINLQLKQRVKARGPLRQHIIDSYLLKFRKQNGFGNLISNNGSQKTMEECLQNSRENDFQHMPS